MVLLAPPAAARGFIEQDLIQALCELRIKLIQQLEIVVIVGGACLFEFGEKTLIGLKDNLPVAPIGNPGKAALQACINPPVTSYLFYFTDRQGTTHFETNDADFERDKAKYGLSGS